MTMTKKTIRLTENHLRNIIENCVKETLTEINWKTAANAFEKSMDSNRPLSSSMKRRLQQNPNAMIDMQDRFKQAVGDKFNKKYGYEDEEGNIYKGQMNWTPGGASFETSASNNNGETYSNQSIKSFSHNDINKRGDITTDNGNNISYKKGILNTKSKLQKAQEKGDNDLKDFYKK